ncbi:hypothetical protein BpHYR1_029100 [Brachionus plicatilis]|uniref:Uncharacterized protein n=1 Tax=Brachionus plicatilis TaxID=10195 RepID=A0A3M7PBX5_BRAPC|nr:hypothetical protein BpHYR1_029100 [Brachionus plicatilis]
MEVNSKLFLAISEKFLFSISLYYAATYKNNILSKKFPSIINHLFMKKFILFLFFILHGYKEEYGFTFSCYRSSQLNENSGIIEFRYPLPCGIANYSVLLTLEAPNDYTRINRALAGRNEYLVIAFMCEGHRQEKNLQSQSLDTIKILLCMLLLLLLLLIFTRVVLTILLSERRRCCSLSCWLVSVESVAQRLPSCTAAIVGTKRERWTRETRSFAAEPVGGRFGEGITGRVGRRGRRAVAFRHLLARRRYVRLLLLMLLLLLLLFLHFVHPDVLAQRRRVSVALVAAFVLAKIWLI